MLISTANIGYRKLILRSPGQRWSEVPLEAGVNRSHQPLAVRVGKSSSLNASAASFAVKRDSLTNDVSNVSGLARDIPPPPCSQVISRMAAINTTGVRGARAWRHSAAGTNHPKLYDPLMTTFWGIRKWTASMTLIQLRHLLAKGRETSWLCPFRGLITDFESMAQVKTPRKNFSDVRQHQ